MAKVFRIDAVPYMRLKASVKACQLPHFLLGYRFLCSMDSLVSTQVCAKCVSLRCAPEETADVDIGRDVHQLSLNK